MSGFSPDTRSLRTFGHLTAVELKAAALAQLIGVVSFVAAAIIYGLITIPSPEAHSPISPPVYHELMPRPAIAPRAVPDQPAAIVKGDIAPSQSGAEIITVSTVESKITSESVIVQIGFGGPSAQKVVPLRQ
jgi:hypothetical protein